MCVTIDPKNGFEFGSFFNLFKLFVNTYTYFKCFEAEAF